jgi:phosphatidylglycerol---prolipoprotein diacylglyceryl transferase
VCPYIVEIGPLKIASYGTMVALAFLAGFHVLKKELERKGMGEELASSLVTAELIGGLVGAKLYFVLFEIPPNQTWGEIFRILFSGSGLVWYGGVGLATLSGIWVVRRHRVSLVMVLDATAPALAVGYAIGRIGCQLAGDGCYGIPTDLPWGMAYPQGVVPTLEKVHPTPVYETLTGLMIFGLLWGMRKRFPQPGFAFCLYLVLAGLVRFLVEFVRCNPELLWGLSDDQLISLGMMGMGLIWGGRLLAKSPSENVSPIVP